VTWIDAHCHLADPRLVLSIDACIERSLEQNIGFWIQGGTSPPDWRAQERLKERYPGVVLCFGLHPWWVASLQSSALASALELLQSHLPHAQAIGEMGLDYAPKKALPRPIQQQAFQAQLRLARSFGKPAVLHVVDAHAEALEMIRDAGGLPQGGLVHGFTGSLETAMQYAAFGLLISVGSGVLKPGYRRLKAAVASLPPDQWAIETDAPDGMLEPSALLQVAEAVAQLRGEKAPAVLDRSTENLKRVFGI
jgi:TatD DNase family protein